MSFSYEKIVAKNFRRSSIYLITMPKYKGKDIMRIRKTLKLSRAEFGRLLSATAQTVEDWEHDNAVPMTAQVRLLYLFDNEPLLVSRYFYQYNELYTSYFEDDNFDDL